MTLGWDERVEMPLGDRSYTCSGPWDDEPDYVRWTSAEGLDCLIFRGTLNALCGYVGLPAGHPSHGITDWVGSSLRVHWGVTYASDEHPVKDKIFPSQSGLWWVGFDCGHLGDLMPCKEMYDEMDVYRDLKFVRYEVEAMSAKLGKEQR